MARLSDVMNTGAGHGFAIQDDRGAAKCFLEFSSRDDAEEAREALMAVWGKVASCIDSAGRIF